MKRTKIKYSSEQTLFEKKSEGSIIQQLKLYLHFDKVTYKLPHNVKIPPLPTQPNKQQIEEYIQKQLKLNSIVFEMTQYEKV